jgi:hypothetical protein
MNQQVITDFIKFYVSSYNQEQFITLWKPYSTITHLDKTYQNEELIQFLSNLCSYVIDITSINVSFTQNGERRANILLTYKMIKNDEQKHVSQFIQLAYSNNKEFWIHSSIIIIN